ncbi:DoxX family protein [Jatrophihabitans fulvus]
MNGPRTRALALAALLAGAGASHFAVPGIYDAMIPEQLPGPPRTWTFGSGAVELAVAAAVLSPATRRHGALAAAGLFVAVLPGNVQMALDARRSDSRAYRAGTVLRLPMQLPLIAWALRVRRES